MGVYLTFRRDKSKNGQISEEFRVQRRGPPPHPTSGSSEVSRGSSEDTSIDNEGCGGVGTTSSDGGNFRRPYTIFVEGNVGSGKSTTLKYFSNRTDVDIVFEPVAQWQNFSGTNFLKLFFEDPKRWTGAFTQLNSLTRYVNSLRPTDR